MWSEPVAQTPHESAKHPAGGSDSVEQGSPEGEVEPPEGSESVEQASPEASEVEPPARGESAEHSPEGEVEPLDGSEPVEQASPEASEVEPPAEASEVEPPARSQSVERASPASEVEPPARGASAEQGSPEGEVEPPDGSESAEQGSPEGEVEPPDGSESVEQASPEASEVEPLVLGGASEQGAEIDLETGPAQVPPWLALRKPVRRGWLMPLLGLTALLAGGGALVWWLWPTSQSDVDPVPAAPTRAPGASAVPTAAKPSPTETAEPRVEDAPPRADRAALKSAAAEGISALEALAKEFPEDPEVWVVLARKRAAKKQYAPALEAAKRALSIEPEASQDGRIASVLWMVAQSRVSEEAFQTLQDMGARGADIALDLATTAAIRRRTGDRAREQIESSWFEAQASTDTRIAAALFMARDCASVRRQLARAKAQGERRTLQRLEALARGTGCAQRTGSECGSCVRDTPESSDAIAAIRSRLGSSGE